MTVLQIRKLADKTGEPPADGEPWPLAGVTFDGAAPSVTHVGNRFVDKGIAEGWISLVGEVVVHRAGGPADNPWGVTHTFRQAERVVFHTTEGDVTYRVTSQPDKVGEGADAVVTWVYGLERVNG